jgi:predicted metal-dependent enzyme (double-stranded beta helix superfamily)
MGDISRLRHFVQQMTALVEDAGDDEERILSDGEKLLGELIAHDDWLPDVFSEADPGRYRQNLLYCDPQERFSVVRFVWGPGQHTPVHDHTVWGMVGVLRGAEICEEFERDASTGKLQPTGEHRMKRGQIDLVSPTIGDIHRVSNALADRPSVSIHVYGGNIGRISRHTYELPGGEIGTFISGYSNEVLPNLWGASV